MAVKVLTDSTSYIKSKVREELDIDIMSLNVTFDDENFRELDIDNDSFYEKMKEKGIPKSSQPSIEDVYNAMKKVVSSGDDLLCVVMSSDMSGTFSTAHMVRDMILEDSKDAKIEIVDSRSNCMQLGFAAIVAARAAKEGKSLEEVKAITLDNINRSRFLFIPDNLVYLKKGGRIGSASALLGNILKIIPILTVEDGKTSILTKVRTKPNATLAMVDKFMDDVKKYGLGEVTIHHINCIGEAEKLASKISNMLNVKVDIVDIGPVIGLHVGPGAIGIAYYTEKDMR